MHELRLYLCALYEDWVARMGGGIGAILVLLPASGWDPLPSWVVWAAAGLCFVVASFRVWRKAHREAHPYEKERLELARDEFRALSEQDKTALKLLVIRGHADLPPENANLLESVFVERKDNGKCHLRPDYKPIATILVKEWEAKRKGSPAH